MNSLPLPTVSGREVGYVALAIFLFLNAAILVVLVVMMATGLDPTSDDKIQLPVLLAATALQFAIMAGAVYLVAIKRSQRSWREFGFRPIGHGTLVAALLIGILLAGILEFVERLFGITLGNQVTNLIAPNGPSIPGYIGVVLLIGIATPLAEELFFRGVLYNWMRSRWSLPVALVFNGVLFGLIHLFYPPAYIVLVGGLGMVFAYAYERTGSLWTPIVLHATHNTAVITAIYLTIT